MKNEKKKIIALIPARGGSKSIKNKNLALLNGKPLIQYAISSAKKSKYINRIIVSTDSNKIKSTALKLGAEVPFLRPKKISGDTTLDYPVMEHMIKSLKLEGKKFKNYILVFLRPTQPLRTFKDIDKVIKEFFFNKKINCVRSVRKSIYPPFWMKKIDKQKNIKPLMNNLYFRKHFRRQDLPETFMCDGYCDAIKIGYLLKEKKFPPKKIKAVKSFTKDFVDIDDKEDLDIASALLNII